MGWLTFVAVAAIVYGFLLQERLDESDATNKKQFADLENRLSQLQQAINQQLDRLDDDLQRILSRTNQNYISSPACV